MSYNDKGRKINLGDVSNFSISIEAVLDCKLALRFFIQYLKDTCNTENANFIMDVQQFREIRYESKRLEKAQYIYDMYIKENSPYELNINSTVREEVIKSIDEGISCRKLMFDSIEHMIVRGMNEQIFPLFIKSKLFEKFVDMSTLNTLYELGTVKKNSLLYYVDGLSNLRDRHVTRNDVEFIESQVLDSSCGWEIIGRSEHHSCWYSKDTYNIGESNRLNFFKYYVDIDESILTCYNTFKELNYRKMIDRNLVTIDNVTYLRPENEEQYYTSITREEYKLVYPFKNREFIVSTSALRVSKDKIVIVMKTSDYPVEHNGKLIRCPSIGGWVFESTGDKTKYCQFHYIDFKGKVPKKIMKLLLKSRAKQFYSKSTDTIEKFKNIGYVSTEDNDIGRTLHDNTCTL